MEVRNFLVPDENKVGSAPTTKIVRWTVMEGQQVDLQWDRNTIVPTNILTH